jgi:hypothetical protein
LILRDGDGNPYPIPTNTTIAGGGYAVFDTLTFGLSADDGARLYLADGTTLLDEVIWHQLAPDNGVNRTWSRCPNATGGFSARPATKGAANDCSGDGGADANPDSF